MRGKRGEREREVKMVDGVFFFNKKSYKGKMQKRRKRKKREAGLDGGGRRDGEIKSDKQIK